MALVLLVALTMLTAGPAASASSDPCRQPQYAP